MAEILAPAGSLEGLMAAVNAGADAVYAGGSRFGARAYAENFTEAQLLEGMDYAHLHGRRVYLTVNTLLKEQELNEELYGYLRPYYENGLDGVIVQDIGVFSAIREWFPDLPLHASTQMTLMGPDGARLLKEMGASRIVTSRELSLKEIKEIHHAVEIEIESFIHGALCYCYSGQCLMSSMIGGRSGNRGRCAQPCRLPYREMKTGRQEYLLSPKDICTLELLPDILEAGVYSLKIEGRMKRAEYAAGVTEVYRSCLDRCMSQGREGYRVSPEEINQLMDLYNRGGFSRGYYQVKNGKEMMSVNRPNHFGTPGFQVIKKEKNRMLVEALEPLNPGDVLENLSGNGKNAGLTWGFSTKKGEKQWIKGSFSGQSMDTVWRRTKNQELLERLHSQYVSAKIKEKINGKLIISPGNPAILELNCKGAQVRLAGDTVLPAQNRPLERGELKRRMEKTGDTPFMFAQLEILCGDNAFLPVQKINELRRDGLAQLTGQLLAPFRRKAEGCAEPADEPADGAFMESAPALAVQVETMEQLEAEGVQEADELWLSCHLAEQYGFSRVAGLCRSLKMKNCRCVLVLPSVFRGKTAEKYRTYRKNGWLAEFDGFLLRNLDEVYFARSLPEHAVRYADFSLYAWSGRARRELRALGIHTDTVPVELNSRECRQRGAAGSQLIIYGRLPLMVSAQCTNRLQNGCTKQPGCLWLKDRKGITFPVKNYCDYCYNVLYNSSPLCLFDCMEEIRRLNPTGGYRICFTTESAGEAGRVMELYRRGMSQGEGKGSSCTRGHFRRGVE